MIILVLGSKKIPCHKALLGYYSEFFDAALFGNFSEATQDEMVILEDVEPMKAFIGWLYTGQIESERSSEELWILGDRLQSKRFTHESMHLLFSTYWEASLCPYTVDLVYRNTIAGSKLRQFIRDAAVAFGPVCSKEKIEKAWADDHTSPDRQSHLVDWKTLIQAGGEFIWDICSVGLVLDEENDNDYYCPWGLARHSEYLDDPSTTRTIQDFIEGKRRRTA